MSGRAGVTVRPARLADAGRLAEVQVDSWRVAYRGLLDDAVIGRLTPAVRHDQWRVALRDDPAATLVAELDGEVAGFCVMAMPAAAEVPEVAEVRSIYVAPRWWRRGIGSALIADAFEEMRGAGYRQAILWTLEGNERGRAFYERVGWRFDEGRRPSQAGGAPEVRYRIELAGDEA
jgi:GNAT superfamily N-acetyltransferase